MKRLLTFVALLFCFTSCGVTSLYYWGGSQNGATAYENLTYKNYDKQTPESLCKLICMYEDIISNTGGKRQLPPPGICAEYELSYEKDYILLAFLLRNNFLWLSENGYQRVSICEDV